jgi:hypothetical protein
MGAIKGAKEYKKRQKGGSLSRAEAVKAHCFMCNGFEESREDCRGLKCPLYAWRPYKGKTTA